MHNVDTDTFNGITINYRRASPARGGSARYFVEAEGYNANGYETLGSAKSAITKRLKAIAAAEFAAKIATIAAQ